MSKKKSGSKKKRIKKTPMQKLDRAMKKKAKWG